MDPKQAAGWYDVAVSYYAPYLHAYDDAPFWHAEPRNLPYRDSICDLAPARLAGADQPRSSPRAWRNTSSSTCSPRPVPASRPRR